MINFIMIRLRFMIFLFVLHPDCARCQSKELVVARYLHAIGGKEKWLSIETKMDSSIIIKFPGEGQLGHSQLADTTHIVTWYSRPNLQRIYRFGKEVSPSTLGFDGRVLWTRSGGITKVQSFEESEYFKSTIMLSSVDLFLEEATQITYEGALELDGKRFDVLKVKREAWIFSSLYYFSEDSGLLYCAISHESVSKMRTYFKNYRSVNGVLWAHLEEMHVAGAITEIAINLKIELNKQMSVKEFQP